MIASIGSRAISALSTFLFVPFYIDILGVEAFAVIALSVSISAILMVLDLGLSASIGREMARTDTDDCERHRSFRAIENVYLLIICCIAILGVLFGQALANNTLSGTSIDRTVIACCLMIVAVEAGGQLLFRFYINAQIGLERHISANLMLIAWTIFRNAFVLILIGYWPYLITFFIWQLGVTLLLAALGRLACSQMMKNWPTQTRALFNLDWKALKKLRQFAFGMLIISLIAALNTQLDKILVSVYFAAEQLTIYTLASTMGTSILISASPVLTVTLPRLTALFTKGQTHEALLVYRKSMRVVALIAYPAAAAIAFNAEEMMYAWTGDRELALHTAPLVPMLLVGNLAIAAATIPHAVAIANGFTTYSNILGVCSFVVSAFGYYFAVIFNELIILSFVYMMVQSIGTAVFGWSVFKKYYGASYFKTLAVDHGLVLASVLVAAFAINHYVPFPSNNRAFAGMGILFNVIACFSVAAFSVWLAPKISDRQVKTHPEVRNVERVRNQ
ncbi:hypothetical protein ASS64_03545 [Erythrobacter sp. AP23]|nr:hypothetical protein ASS64_03545 [Erythrobacter sp. AP23]